MFLSILIPTYNHDWTPLAKELLKQAEGSSAHTMEIIVMDDASTHEVSPIYGVSYTHLNQNVGRAKIRNLLAQRAHGSHLLFLDDDTFPVNDNFLREMTSQAERGVVVGGLMYRKSPDIGTLRYKYGVSYEQKSASVRKSSPYDAFISCAFLIDKQSFDTISFDESYSSYGHEDTKFGIELRKAGIPIYHIEAPVYHDNTDSNEEYLKKTRLAIESLLEHRDTAEQQSKLMRLYLKFSRLHIAWTFKLFFLCFNKLLKYNLTGKYPSITLYNLYKMGYLATKY